MFILCHFCSPFCLFYHCVLMGMLVNVKLRSEVRVIVNNTVDALQFNGSPSISCLCCADNLRMFIMQSVHRKSLVKTMPLSAHHSHVTLGIEHAPQSKFQVLGKLLSSLCSPWFPEKCLLPLLALLNAQGTLSCAL